MSEALKQPSAEDLALRILAVAAVHHMGPRKARAALERMADMLCSLRGHDYPDNVRPIRPPSPDVQRRQEAARAAIAAVETVLASHDRPPQNPERR